MENGTEIGLGVGAVLTSVLAYFGIRAKKEEDPMATLTKRLSAIESDVRSVKERQDFFEKNISEQYKGIRSDIKQVNEFLFRLLEKE